MNTHESWGGFTIVEVIVSLVVVSLFTAFFFQLYFAMESQRLLVLRRAEASDIAYKNLRKFSTRPPITTTDCTNSNMDLKTNNISGTTGMTLGSETDTTSNTYGFIAEDTTKIGKNTKQRVAAYAPNGCSSTLIQIVSTVTFDNEEMRHVSYVQ